MMYMSQNARVCVVYYVQFLLHTVKHRMNCTHLPLTSAGAKLTALQDGTWFWHAAWHFTKDSNTVLYVGEVLRLRVIASKQGEVSARARVCVCVCVCEFVDS